MKRYQIHLGDWKRILLGEVPRTFYLELVIRALVVYLILMISMRVMGKRMSSQLSRNELAALVSLAAAVGVPLMAPNRGLLPAVVIAIVVVGVQRVIADLAAKRQTFEKISQGNMSILINESVIDIDALSRVGLSQAQLFAQLRGKSIKQLGMVDRFYMEANGSFTLIKRGKPQPGLSVLPDVDPEFAKEFDVSENIFVCDTCGTSSAGRPAENKKCPRCGHKSWTGAVT
jgi:uncharacterized membrane protein YcaP (DUF421 family)